MLICPGSFTEVPSERYDRPESQRGSDLCSSSLIGGMHLHCGKNEKAAQRAAFEKDYGDLRERLLPSTPRGKGDSAKTGAEQKEGGGFGNRLPNDQKLSKV